MHPPARGDRQETTIARVLNHAGMEPECKRPDEQEALAWLAILMSSISPDALDNAIAGVLRERIAELPPFVSALVREPSTLGNEEPAQQMIADRLTASGFTVERVQVDGDAALADPHAGYPPLSYDRSKLGGRAATRRGTADARCT